MINKRLLCLGVISLGVIFDAVGISHCKENLQDFISIVQNLIVVSINRRTEILRPHTDPSKADESYFGKSLAVSGNLLFVGAPFGDANNVQGEGSTAFLTYPDPSNIPYQGYVEVFEITDSGINKYTKGDAFDKDRTPEQKTKEANVIRPHTDPSKEDDSNFGSSIAVSGNLLFVGAPQGDANNEQGSSNAFQFGNPNNRPNQGFVEVFEIKDSGIFKYSKGGDAFDKDRSEDQLEKEAHVIRPHTDPSKTDDSQFGSSLAVSCNLLFVGAPEGGGVKQGFVEVFEITDSGINKYTKGDAFDKDRTPEQKTKEANVIRPHTDPSGADNSQFGSSIAVSKNLLVVGAPLGDANNDDSTFSSNPEIFPSQGFVEVFEITDSGIFKYSKGGDAFDKNDDPRDDEELKKERHVIRPHTHPSKADKSSFGYSIALSKNLLVVGATTGDANNVQVNYTLNPTTNKFDDQGFVEVFEITDDSGIIKYTKGGDAFDKDRTPEQKTKEANVIRPHTDPSKKDNSYFGYSIAVSKNLLVVGAPIGDANNVDFTLGGDRPNQGFVEVFEITDDSGIVKYTKGDAFDKDRSEEQLEKERHVIRPHTDPDKKDNSQFGYSIALSKNLLFVGAPRGDAINEEGSSNPNNRIDQGFVEVFDLIKE